MLFVIFRFDRYPVPDPQQTLSTNFQNSKIPTIKRKANSKKNNNLENNNLENFD